MSSPSIVISHHDAEQVERANRSGLQPVVLVHGLWLLPGSWDRWAALLEEEGFVALAPAWPAEPETVEEAREHPDAFAERTVGEVCEHHDALIRTLDRPPALIGHSFGGLLVQMLAGRGLAAATVAISPAGFRGVLPLPLSALKAARPVLANPANRHRGVPLTYEQFRYGFANAVEEDEARALYEQFAVPAPGAPLFQAAAANLNPWTEIKADTRAADRGPLLIISSDQDHQAPTAIARASFERQRRNEGVTEHLEVEGHGHALTVDARWREVADPALAFLRRFV